MPESWCGRGVRSCSELGLRVALDEGRDSMKLCMDPRRRGAVVVVAEENEDKRRRVFWRVNGPVTTPNARDSELECEWCDAPQSTCMSPSLTASSAMPESFTSR
jgi:hypothetical protein